MESVLIHTNPSGKELRILTATSNKETVNLKRFWLLKEDINCDKHHFLSITLTSHHKTYTSL
jgi:hypothetical protein